MKLIANLRRFARAKSGLAALEFAILLPMMVFVLFGSVDLIDVLGANKRAQNVAASVADVVARDTEITNSEVQGLWAAVEVLMFPNTGANMEIRVTSISIVSSTSAKVVWSEGHGGYAPRQVNSTVALPSAMMQTGSSVIMTETIYHYTPPLGFIWTGPADMRHTAYRRSRLIDPIPRLNQ
ncbi:TadE/TadG family type IV pilus assembly protein [Terricaulis sp.]|uniref:TadE/TadG family type IV pilus assembly protein n=1 Tax=Terricaulis sp. TaxID=2768686 RepID=UPI0037836B56